MERDIETRCKIQGTAIVDHFKFSVIKLKSKSKTTKKSYNDEYISCLFKETYFMIEKKVSDIDKEIKMNKVHITLGHRTGYNHVIFLW